MAELFFTYLRTGFLAGVMILAVLLARPFLRKAPRNIVCILWLLVAVRLLLPFQLESPLSLQPRQLAEPAAITDVAELLPEPEPETAPLPITPPEMPVSEETGPEPETVFAMIWAAGALTVMLYAMLSYGILRYRVRDAVRCPDGAWESDRIGGAFLLGYFRPQIYIPTGLNSQDRSFILAHERSHQKRCDHWWKLLGMICLSIHWYNPLVWLSYGLLCRDIEIACDERVICSMVLEERKFYSLALLNSGKRLSGFLAYPVAFGEISLKGRIKSVLSYRKPGVRITVAAAALVLVVAVCFMTIPETEAAVLPEEAVQTTEPTTAGPTVPTTEPVAPTETFPSQTVPTEPVTLPTEPVTVPTETTKPATEPAPTKPAPTTPKPTTPAEPETEPIEPTTPTKPSVAPTEPAQPQVTKPTEPETTEPPTTVPSVNIETGISVVAKGKYDGGPIQWKVTSDGVLTIWGNGRIQGSYDYPWSAYRDQITVIILEGGVRSIAQGAFDGMYNVTKVTLPKTVRSIGTNAFRNCASLTSLTIPYQVKTLEAYLFQGSAVKTVTFVGEAPSSIDSCAFSGINATVYYPADYDTWTTDLLQDYGGKLTWMPV